MASHNFLAKLLLGLAVSAVAYSANAATEILDVNLKSAAKAVRTENYSEAFRLYSRAANAGSAEAQYQLANLYRLGRGVAKNSEQEIAWLQKAAQADHAASQYALSLALASADPAAAATWLSKSAAAGYTPAQTLLQRNQESKGVSENLSAEQQWFAAARKNNVNELKTLFAAGENIDQADADGRTALMVAVQAKAGKAVAWLLANKANANRSDRFGKNAGFIALDAKQGSVFTQLFAHGLSPTAQLSNGDTLLHYAVRRKLQEPLAILLDANVPINQANQDGWTVLDLAQSTQQENALALLSAHGAQHGPGWQLAQKPKGEALASQWRGSGPVTITQFAQVVSSGNLALAKSMLKANPDLLTTPLADGSNILSVAITSGQEAMVEMLVAAGANPNAQVSGSLNSLQLAARLNQRAVAEKLLPLGAHIATDSNSPDAVEIALRAGFADFAIWLVKTAPELNNAPLDRYAIAAAKADAGKFLTMNAPRLTSIAQDAHGRSAAWFAADAKNPDMVAQLLRLRLVSDQPDRNGNTPFLIAVDRGCNPCAAKLLPKANINHQNAAGDTALILASGHGDSTMVKWLLSNKADPSTRNSLGDSALIAAVRMGDAESAKALIQAGASTTRKNKMGLSALQIAREKGGVLLSSFDP